VGKVGICIPENYNSPPTGEVLAIRTPTYPEKSPSSALKPGISGDTGDLHELYPEL